MFIGLQTQVGLHIASKVYHICARLPLDRRKAVRHMCFSVLKGKMRVFTLLFSMLLAACAAGPSGPATPQAALATPLPSTPQRTPQPTLIPTAAASPATAPAPTPTVSQLVDVGGHKLFVECQGSGSPTVVLDAGLGVVSRTWYKVQPQVAALTQVCRYDRAGLEQSDPGPRPRTSQRFVQELHTLLANARIGGPYVLVGQSLGGLNMQLYASTYPGEVVGLVLVDSLHPDLDSRIEPLLSPAQVKQRREELELNQEHVRFTDILSSEAQVRAAGPLPDVPLVVIRHGIAFDGPPDWPTEAVERLWTELQTDLAGRTAHGKLILAPRSHHRIQEDQPEIVSAAIREVVDAAMQNAKCKMQNAKCKT